MSASSSSGGIIRIVSSQGAGSAPASLVQSSIRSSCSRHPGYRAEGPAPREPANLLRALDGLG